MSLTGRVILHLDLDCFYCQVEQKRLGIPREVPAAVQQWDGLIAVNYAARGKGVTRHMRVQQAMQKCPELQCLHVQTLGGEDGQSGVEGAVNGGSTHPNDRLLQKACLERYRKASAEIVAVIRKLIPEASLEKASIDEVFVDVTTLVEKELLERDDSGAAEHTTVEAFSWGSIVEGGPLITESEMDRRLSVGAQIACRVRGAIRDTLDFTSSVGIAHNKLLSKVGSARNKPDQQTIITSRGIADLMEDLPLKKLRNFGGKLGAELEALGATTAGQAAAIPMPKLVQHFGERAKFIYNCVRGMHDEPVKVRELSKSMLAAKSFEATSDTAALARWLGILADELADRMTYDAETNQRTPRLLVLSYRQKNTPAGKSRSTAMPRAPGGPTAEMLKAAALEVLLKCADAIPCCNLGLTATEFQDTPGDEQGCITRFLQAKPGGGAASAAKQEGPPANASPTKRSHQPSPRLAIKKPKRTIEQLFRKAQPPANVRNDDFQASFPSAAPPEGSSKPAASASDDAAERRGRGEAPAEQADKESGMSEVRRTEDQGGVSCREAGIAGAEGQSEGLLLSAGPRNMPGESLDAKAADTSAPPTTGLPDEIGEHREVGRADESNFAEAKGVEHNRETGEEGGRAGDAGPEEGMIEGIDMEEQRRIMHEIWVQKNLQKPSLAAVQRKVARKTQSQGTPKQPRMTDMFRKRP